jgi:hypothetical protein
LCVFVVSLSVLLISLTGFLFGVRLEAVMPASAIVAARDQHDVRALVSGLIDPGWHEGLLPQTKGPPLRLRLDDQGNGMADPAQSSARVREYRLADGRQVLPAEFTFHRIETGDVVWPGLVLGRIRSDELDVRLRTLKARLEDLDSRGESARETLVEYNSLRQRLEQAVVRVPAGADPWLVLKVHVLSMQAVKPGDPVVQIAPVDPQTHQPRQLIALLDVHEKHTGELTADQTVRLYATTHNQRLHGHAEGRLLRVEPLAELGSNGERHFRAQAAITHTPFPLRLGSTCKAEIVVGRKQVYRIILEQ